MVKKIVFFFTHGIGFWLLRKELRSTTNEKLVFISIRILFSPRERNKKKEKTNNPNNF